MVHYSTNARLLSFVIKELTVNRLVGSTSVQKHVTIGSYRSDKNSHFVRYVVNVHGAVGCVVQILTMPFDGLGELANRKTVRNCKLGRCGFLEFLGLSEE